MTTPRVPFLAIGSHQQPTGRRVVLTLLSFLLPLGIWATVSYVPFIYHPLMEIRVPGASAYTPGDRIPRQAWQDLVLAEADWAGAVADGALLTGPDATPLSASDTRRIRRHNTTIWRQFAPLLVAADRLPQDQSRDDAAIRQALIAWQTSGLADPPWPIPAVTRERLAALLAMPADADGAFLAPEDRILVGPLPQAVPANPVYLPAPHEVLIALGAAFTTAPPRDDDPWLHERLLHSLWIVVKGFGLAMLVGLPLGLLAGTFGACSRLVEPVVNFVGYIPPPAFAALLVGILGLQDGPKVGIVFIASVFPMILMTANTVRRLDHALLEAAQTLGADRRSLLLRVIIPGALPRIVIDLRVLLALGWTILIIAEITGEKSGLSAYMEQQGRYRHYENVFAAMLIIGCIGLVVDQFLAACQPLLFPWQGGTAPAWLRHSVRILTWVPRWARQEAVARAAALAAARSAWQARRALRRSGGKGPA